MPRFRITLLLALVLPLLAALPAQADELTNTVCPVMTDEPADETYSLEYEGRMVYFCCGKCLKRFKADPEPYLKNLPQFGGVSPVLPGMELQAEQVPVDSPLADEPVTADEEDSSEREMPKPPKEAELPVISEQPVAQSGITEFLGRFHVVLVHFPIALILVALFSEIWGGLIRQAPYWAATRLLLVIAVISGIAARMTGIWAGQSEEWVGKLGEVIERHELIGTITVFLALAAVMIGELAVRTNKGGPTGLLIYRGLLLAAAICVSLTGWLGGELVHGIGHLGF